MLDRCPGAEVPLEASIHWIVSWDPHSDQPWEPAAAGVGSPEKALHAPDASSRM